MLTDKIIFKVKELQIEILKQIYCPAPVSLFHITLVGIKDDFWHFQALQYVCITFLFLLSMVFYQSLLWCHAEVVCAVYLMASINWRHVI